MRFFVTKLADNAHIRAKPNHNANPTPGKSRCRLCKISYKSALQLTFSPEEYSPQTRPEHAKGQCVNIRLPKVSANIRDDILRGNIRAATVRGAAD
jgi:hypothetical protein